MNDAAVREGCFLSLVTEEGLLKTTALSSDWRARAMTNEQRATIDSLRAQGLGYKKIANMISISPNTVKSYLRQAKPVHMEKPAFEPLPQPASPKQAECKCDNCGKTIEQVSGQKRKRFCSDSCRNAWWNSHLDQVRRRAIYHFTCPACGKQFSAYGNAQRKYCSRACYLEGRYGGRRCR